MSHNKPSTTISFEDTSLAFAYKSNGQLKKAHFLFSQMGNPFFLKLGLKLMPLAIKFKFPFIKSIIKATIFQQFVGGETLEETVSVANELEKYNVKVILDYGVEGGEGEAAFDNATKEFISVIEYAATQSNIPFISIKITGIARFGLLEKLNEVMLKNIDADLLSRLQLAANHLSEHEKIEWEKVVSRLEKICIVAQKNNISVLVDAEESWIQEPIDAIAIEMSIRFNKEKAIIYNTIQMYRHSRLDFLNSSLAITSNNGVINGVKLVRGAYMEKERKRAIEKNYLSPIQTCKENTDKDYNEALEFCINNLKDFALIVASHNEYSNLYATQLLSATNLAANHANIHFSQLYGMSDNITFNLANATISVSKYLPFGPIKDVIPYLMRRAQENSSVAGQTGRELSLIKKELQRRKSVGKL